MSLRDRLKTEERGHKTHADGEPQKGKVGRAPKPDEEKVDQRVPVLFTKKELAEIEERRGMVPRSAWIRDLVVRAMGETNKIPPNLNEPNS